MNVTDLGVDTRLTVAAAGAIFLWALVLGAIKYEQIRRSPLGHAHPYIDIAHRAALLYAFATTMLAVFVELGAFDTTVNLASVAVLELFFVASIASYMAHGLRRDTDNQLLNPSPPMQVFMWTLIVGEIGAFGVLFVGFVIAAL